MAQNQPNINNKNIPKIIYVITLNTISPTFSLPVMPAIVSINILPPSKRATGSILQRATLILTRASHQIKL